MSVQVGNGHFKALSAMVRRRPRIAMATGGLVFVVVASLPFLFPKEYRSSALLLIEGAAFVDSSENVAVETRLEAISQEILSNDRLAKLVQDFQLLHDPSPQALVEEIERVRSAVTVQVTEEAHDRGVAFFVSFSGADPQKVMDVTNALTSFYVEHKSRTSTPLASDAITVSQAEIDQVKQQLEKRKQQIQQYKDQYKEELPERLNANTTAAEDLRERIKSLTDELAHRREQRPLFANQATRKESARKGNPSTLEILRQRVVILRQELADLRTRFPETDPNVEQTKRELEGLEQRLEFRSRRAVGEKAGKGRQEPHAEIVGLEQERKQLQQQLNDYQQRIANTPKRELGLQSLTRDYDAVQEKYSVLVGQQAKSQSAHRQQEEQIRVLEPATSPISPLGSHWLLLLLAAVVLGVGAGLCGVIAWEQFIDTSFHNAEDLEQETKFPVLVSIPRMKV